MFHRGRRKPELTWTISWTPMSMSLDVILIAIIAEKVAAGRGRKCYRI